METGIVRNIMPLIVPSAETLTAFGAEKLKVLIENVNKGWNNSISIISTRLQHNYSVRLGREAFTKNQLEQLQPFVDEVADTFLFMATYYIYFPFSICEVKCGTGDLETADRHSMTMAMRGIIELFKLAKREKELHRKIFAFFVSYNHLPVRIYGHYSIIETSKTIFYRHPIHTLKFDGKNK